MRLYLATENAGKVRELRAMLADAVPHAEVFSVADLPAEVRSRYSAEETGTTYAENALIKAQALVPLVDGFILAEDSGFEVAALGGEPGVYSARYAADDKARCAKILAALDGKPAAERRAKFVACMVVLDAERNPTYFYGEKEGYIAAEARGDAGFGYDPIFCPEWGSLTWAETDAAIKNRDSHRSKALAAAVNHLAGL